MSPQCKALLSYLKANRQGITQLEAFNTLGICRLSERIREIEGDELSVDWGKCKYGVDYAWINREKVKVPTRSGYATVTRYFLA